MDFKLILYGLAIGCPVKNEKDDCPIKEIRKLACFTQKINYINSLSFYSQKELYLKHKACLWDKGATSLIKELFDEKEILIEP